MTVPIKKLTRRQRQVLSLRAAGYTYGQIGEQLGISPNTVRNHVWHARSILFPGVTNREGDGGGYRLIYVMGLLHGGVSAHEIPAKLEQLVSDVKRDVATMNAKRRRATLRSERHN